MRRHLYDLRFSFIPFLALLVGLGIAGVSWGGDITAEGETSSPPLSTIPSQIWYDIDWAKIRTCEDLIEVLSLLPIAISDSHESFEKIRRFLKEKP